MIFLYNFSGYCLNGHCISNSKYYKEFVALINLAWRLLRVSSDLTLYWEFRGKILITTTPAGDDAGRPLVSLSVDYLKHSISCFSWEANSSKPISSRWLFTTKITKWRHIRIYVRTWRHRDVHRQCKTLYYWET